MGPALSRRSLGWRAAAASNRLLTRQRSRADRARRRARERGLAPNARRGPPLEPGRLASLPFRGWPVLPNIKSSFLCGRVYAQPQASPGRAGQQTGFRHRGIFACPLTPSDASNSYLPSSPPLRRSVSTTSNVDKKQQGPLTRTDTLLYVVLDQQVLTPVDLGLRCKKRRSGRNDLR
jgi:hypothetical protein